MLLIIRGMMDELNCATKNQTNTNVYLVCYILCLYLDDVLITRSRTFLLDQCMKMCISTCSRAQQYSDFYLI